jgi:hypothetical protein
MDQNRFQAHAISRNSTRRLHLAKRPGERTLIRLSHARTGRFRHRNPRGPCGRPPTHDTIPESTKSYFARGLQRSTLERNGPKAYGPHRFVRPNSGCSKLWSNKVREGDRTGRSELHTADRIGSDISFMSQATVGMNYQF